MIFEYDESFDPKDFQKWIIENVKPELVVSYSAMGFLIQLWGKSRSLGLMEATQKQIDGWLHKGATKHLLACRYLKKNGDKYIIVDNEGHI